MVDSVSDGALAMIDESNGVAAKLIIKEKSKNERI